MPTESYTPKVNAAELFKQIALEMKHTSTAMGLSIIYGCLHRIAEEAIKSENEAILRELTTICVVAEKPEGVPL